MNKLVCSVMGDLNICFPEYRKTLSVSSIVTCSKARIQSVFKLPKRDIILVLNLVREHILKRDF